MKETRLERLCEEAELGKGEKKEARLGDRGHGGVVGLDTEPHQQGRCGFYGCHTSL